MMQLLCLCCLLWQALLPAFTQAHVERGRMVWRAMPNGQVERMSYNAGGQLESSTDFRGFVTRYAYDLRGRMTLKAPDARLNEATLTWSYPNENTRIATRGSLQTTYTSSAQRGWLQSVQSPTGTLSYGYDDGGQKTSVSAPSGLTSYSYDVLGRLQNVYDQPTGTSNPTAIAAYDYDNVGNLKSVSRGNGIVTSYGYDEMNRLSDMVNAKGASEVSRFHYPVRSDGKRTGLTERLVNADLVNNAPRVSNRGVSYGYDDAGRLTREAGDDGAGVAYQTGYTYDKVGNRTDTLYKRATTAAPNTFSHSTTVASVFNANDWLTGQSIQNDGGAVQTQSYTYDRSGSQLTEQNGSNTPQENDWGFDGKLQGTKTQGQNNGGISYTTDASGNRVGVTLNSGLATQKTTRYLVDENTSYASVVEERAPDTNDTAAQELQARYVWGQALAPLAMWRKGSDGTVRLFFMLTDGQESVRQLSNASGSVTDSYFYDAWGNGLGGGSGTTVNPFRYTGQMLDSSGKYFLRARYYDSSTGRFLSHDPLMGDDSDPVSLHRYLYAGAEPVGHVDPSGKESLVEVGVTLTATTGIGAATGGLVFNKVLGGSFLGGAIVGGRIGLSLGVAQLRGDLVKAIGYGFYTGALGAFNFYLGNAVRGGQSNPFDKDLAQRLGIEFLKNFASGAEGVAYSVEIAGLPDEVVAGLTTGVLTFLADLANGDPVGKAFKDALAQALVSAVVAAVAGSNTGSTPVFGHDTSKEVQEMISLLATPLSSAVGTLGFQSLYEAASGDTPRPDVP